MQIKDVITGIRNRQFGLLTVVAMVVCIMTAAGLASHAVAGDVTTVPLSPAMAASGAVDVAANSSLSVIGGSVVGAEAGTVIASEDGTSFKAPAQVSTGDQFAVHLTLANKSQSRLDAEITISAPEGLTMSLRGMDGAHGVVQTGPNTWVFSLDGNENDEEPDLAVTVAVGDVVAPGFYGLKCSIEPLGFQGS